MALNIPKELRAGDTITFSDSLTNYPAPTWTLTYTLINYAGKIAITSTASGEDHAFNIAPGASSQFEQGSYSYQATVSDGTNRFTVGAGMVTVAPNFQAETTKQLTHVEKCLNALEAVLEGKASQDQQAMQFNGRSITRFSPSELLMWRDKYRGELARMKQAERLKLGLRGAGQVRARF